MASAPGSCRPTSTRAWRPACARRQGRWRTRVGARVTRIDFLSDGNELVVNEINTIPLLARYCGSSRRAFAQLLDDLLTEPSGDRPPLQRSGCRRLVLRGASSIAEAGLIQPPPRPPSDSSPKSCSVCSLG